MAGRESLPARGAWIEIAQAGGLDGAGGSLPARGAWIEIEGPDAGERAAASLPARGAWIEILQRTRPLLV